ncbi:MAG: hypothetical protein DRJ09_10690 [Bacteroidetes bacterium]|nr:MAG: hypothetical protein DRJ09_10690 [Bacteroidota bacterium]
MTKEKVTKINKDNPLRSISKAISWRIIASGATFLISFIIFKQYTDKTNNEVLQTASIITGVDVVAKLLLYYLHERVWTNITWGKYWERRARRKYIKKMRKTINNNN